MSIVRKQPTLLVLLGWVALTTLAALTQTAFAYQGRAKQASVTLKDNKPTQTAFTYQGQLKEGSVPANGTYTFRFALYPGQSGGRNLGVVIKDEVVVNKGSFTVQLDFGSDGSSSNESWLEVGARRANTADSYTELSPRQRLTPMPSAIAAQAEPRRVIGVPLAPQDLGAWIKDGRTVRLATSTDNVGIGTTKPVATLDVAGTIHASEAVTVGNSVGLLSSGSLNLIEVDNSNPLAIGFSSPFVTNPNPVAFATVKVGIGTTSPTNTLDVNGQARIRVLPLNAALNDVVVADPTTGVLFTRPASTIGGGGSFWSLSGNAATPGNFLGTTVNVPLEIRVSNSRAMLIQYHPQSPNIIGGSPANSVTAGVGGATIAGGGFAAQNHGNTVTANFGTVGGGRKNQAGNLATVGGGYNNTASGTHSTVGGGANNTASGSIATVPGGSVNTAAGNVSFAAGCQAKANHNGAFVWADVQGCGNPFASTANDQFNVRASGGTRFFSNPSANVGVQLPPGGNAWSALSDRNVKENFVPVNGRLILQKLSLIPITEWNLKSQDSSIRHIGPMAQDFYAAFGLGESDRYISTSDADGITLGSIQALYQMSLEKDKKIEELQQRIEKLEKLVGTLLKK